MSLLAKFVTSGSTMHQMLGQYSLHVGHCCELSNSKTINVIVFLLWCYFFKAEEEGNHQLGWFGYVGFAIGYV